MVTIDKTDTFKWGFPLFHRRIDYLLYTRLPLLTCHMEELSFLISKTSPSTFALNTSHLFKDFTPSVIPISSASPVFSSFVLFPSVNAHALLSTIFKSPLWILGALPATACFCSFHSKLLKTHCFLHFTSHSSFNHLQSSFIPFHATCSCQSHQRYVVKPNRYFSFLIVLVFSVASDTINQFLLLEICLFLFILCCWPLNVGVLWTCRPNCHYCLRFNISHTPQTCLKQKSWYLPQMCSSCHPHLFQYN